MNTWNALVQTALIGTDKPWQLARDDSAQASPAIHALLEQTLAKSPQAPGQLLRLAGVLTVCRRAGWIAPPTHTPAPPPAEPETRQLASSTWTHLLSEACIQGPLRLQIQVLQACNGANVRAPATLLPQMLTLGRATVALRPSLLPVLGERGRWLATHNPEWSYACGAQETADPETHWQHGSLEQRRAVLLAERATAPDLALQRLIADWGDLPGKDRAALITTLATGLNAGDETFLATQLTKDRAQDVRRSAADLLSALPGSAYSLRQGERLAPLVTVAQSTTGGLVKKLLGRGTTATTVTIEAPTAADPAWKADQIDADLPKYESLGERAWWLYQLTCRSSLAWWTQHTGLTPESLVAAATTSDWTQALLRGWTHAVQHQPDPAWAQALLPANSTSRWGNRAALLALLSPQQCEQHHLSRLEKSSKNLNDAIASCLETCPPHSHWGLELSTAIIDKLQKAMTSQQMRYDYGLRYQLPDITCALHPQTLNTWFEMHNQPSDDTNGMTEQINLLNHVLRSRNTLATLTHNTH